MLALLELKTAPIETRGGWYEAGLELVRQQREAEERRKRIEEDRRIQDEIEAEASRISAKEIERKRIDGLKRRERSRRRRAIEAARIEEQASIENHLLIILELATLEQELNAYYKREQEKRALEYQRIERIRIERKEKIVKALMALLMEV